MLVRFLEYQSLGDGFVPSRLWPNVVSDVMQSSRLRQRSAPLRNISSKPLQPCRAYEVIVSGEGVRGEFCPPMERRKVVKRIHRNGHRFASTSTLRRRRGSETSALQRLVVQHCRPGGHRFRSDCQRGDDKNSASSPQRSPFQRSFVDGLEKAEDVDEYAFRRKQEKAFRFTSCACACRSDPRPSAATPIPC